MEKELSLMIFKGMSRRNEYSKIISSRASLLEEGYDFFS